MTALTLPDERTDLDLTEGDDSRPPLLHAYCQHCIDTLPEVTAMCGFKKRSSADFEGKDPNFSPSDLCVVCVEVQWAPCKVCGS
jgi:hypothetical protein